MIKFDCEPHADALTLSEIGLRWSGGCSVCARPPWSGGFGFVCTHAAALTQPDVNPVRT
jgi:hypothetical protein